jgi:hypothetical protein
MVNLLPSIREQACCQRIGDKSWWIVYMIMQFPRLKERGIQKCQLEVIQENERAIRVYQRIGFAINRSLFCYKAQLSSTQNGIDIQKTDIHQLKIRTPDTHLAWDFHEAGLATCSDRFESYNVLKGKEEAGYFIVDAHSETLVDLEAVQGDYASVINGIAMLRKQIKINNIDARRTKLLAAIQEAKWTPTVRQFEMEMQL